MSEESNGSCKIKICSILLLVVLLLFSKFISYFKAVKLKADSLCNLINKVLLIMKLDK